MVQLGGMLLAQQQGVAAEALVVPQHDAAGFQLADKVGILPRRCLSNPPADQALLHGPSFLSNGLKKGRNPDVRSSSLGG